MVFSITLLNEPSEILKFLQIGTKIPIWHEFHKYILHDLKFFKAKSILLADEGNIVGHILVFDDECKNLYFGFFGVINDTKSQINFLIQNLIKYAKTNNYKKIIGPINIPAIIFGWGFMEEGSIDTLYIGKSVNPPLYNKLFIKNSFEVRSVQQSWEGELPKILLEMIKETSFKDYAVFSPTDSKELKRLLGIMIKLNLKNMPTQSIVTPRVNEVIGNYIQFSVDYGGYSLFKFIKYKKTGEIVGYMASLPNPFRKNSDDIHDSFSPFAIVIDIQHRGKGLSWYIMREVIRDANKNGIHYFSTPLESKHEVSLILGEKLNLKTTRKHIIYEYSIDPE